MQLTELQRDAMAELMNIGMGQAAASLSQIVGEEVKLSIPNVELLSRQEAANTLKTQPEERIAAIKQTFKGPFWGDALLLFPESKSIELVESITKGEVPRELIPEIEQDALLEVGNIILNACLGSLANLLTHEVSSELPIYITGLASDILCHPTGEDNDVVLFLRTDFELPSNDVSGYVAFILDIPSLEQVQTSIDRYLGQIT